MAYFYIYRILSIILIPATFLNFIYRILNKKVDLARIGEQLGFNRQAQKILKAKKPKKVIWIHAASVGETLIALKLVEEMSVIGRFFVLTTRTLTSAHIVLKKNLPNLIHQYAPNDNTYCIKKFLALWRPDIGIFIESELWPNLTYLASQKFKIVLVNARMSDKSYNRWLYCPGLIKFCLKRFSFILSQSKSDNLKFQNLGAINLVYGGNIKYCITPPDIDNKELLFLLNHVQDRTIVFAASTHQGDEDFISLCYAELKKLHKNLLLIIAPRHPSRLNEILNVLTKKNLTISIRSKKELINPLTDVYLVDTFGELSLFYSIAKVSFIGGSLKNGGHNLLEASFFDTTIVFGPDMSNFSEIAEEYLQNKAAISFNDLSGCIRVINEGLSNAMEIKNTSKNATKLISQKTQILPLYIQYLNTVI